MADSSAAAQQLALAQKYAQASLAPALALIRQQQARADAANLARGQSIQGFATAAANMAKGDAAAVQAPFDTASHTIAGLGAGYSGLAQNAINQDAQAQNDFLAKIGSPQHVAAPQASDAIYHMGGAVPATQLSTAGAGFGAAAALQPGNLLARGQQDFTSNAFKGTEGDQTFADQIQQLAATSPKLAQDFLTQLQNASTINATLSAARGYEVNSQGQPVLSGGKLVPYTPYTKPASATPGPIVKTSGGYVRVNPDGTITNLGIQPPAAKASAATHLQSKTINGHVATFDPTTGTYYIPGTTTPVDPNSFTKPAKVSPVALRNARSFLFQNANGYWALASDPEKPIPQSTLRSAQTADQRAVAAWQKAGAVGAKPTPTVVHTGVAPNEDREIQRLYVTLVKQYGIPARQAFQMVAGNYKNWAAARKSAYFPKAEAAQGVASPTAATTPAGAKQTAFQIASSKYGWTGADLQALDRLWTNESGWNYQARNGSSGADGIPQALGHALPADYATNPVSQIEWGLNYIKQRYGSPSRALAFWLGPKPANGPQGNWY